MSITEKPRILAVHEDVGTLRLIRETLLEFTECEVDTSPKADYAFELALQREYKLFFFGLTTPMLPGELLYDLVSKAYLHCHAGARTAPAVVYVADAGSAVQAKGLQSDARVKGVLMKPVTIDRVLNCVEGVLEKKK